MIRLIRIALAASALAVLAHAQSPFVQASGAQLTLNGQPFRCSGTNNYYLMYSSQPQVDAIFDTVTANGFKVLRTWAWIDIGYVDGTQSVAPKPNGIYFHYWTGTAPAFNDDDNNGLKRLDYVIYKASQTGVKLILPFTNNWTDFGGMDQYVRWRGAKTHDAFYTDPVIRGWYRDYMAHLLTRVNTYSGIAYKDDPAIMGWELANEPRCGGSGLYPTSSSCTTATLTAWAGEMASYIKSIDPNHLVSVGDEGFYCKPDAPRNDWTMNCTQGVDTVALAQAPGIDWMSFHLYPGGWSRSTDWGTQWVTSHFNDAAAIGKPALMGEFGYEFGSLRLPAYKQWTDALLAAQGVGGMFWWLTRQSAYDSLDVACPSAVCTLMTNLGPQLDAGQVLDFAPIVDDHEFKTEFETPTLLKPVTNAIAYNNATLDVTTIALDADPSSGAFALQSDGSVLFIPSAGFAGKTATRYTVADSNGRVSNAGQIRVTVNPKAGAAFTLFSFETGTEGWDAGSWQSNIGTVAVSTDWAVDGSQSLKVNATADGWFGVTLSPAQSWAGKTKLTYQVKTLDQGTSTAAVIKVGNSYLWCQGDFGVIPAGTETMLSVDLTKMGCGVPDLSKVQEMYVWFSGGGTYYLDAVRLQ